MFWCGLWINLRVRRPTHCAWYVLLAFLMSFLSCWQERNLLTALSQIWPSLKQAMRGNLRLINMRHWTSIKFRKSSDLVEVHTITYCPFQTWEQAQYCFSSHYGKPPSYPPICPKPLFVCPQARNKIGCPQTHWKESQPGELSIQKGEKAHPMVRWLGIVFKWDWSDIWQFWILFETTLCFHCLTTVWADKTCLCISIH